MRKTFIIVAIILLITLSAIFATKFFFGGSNTILLSKFTTMTNLQISAPREHNGSIPGKYTCDGANINPPLKIQGVPKDAKSLVLIMDDPDIPQFVKDKFGIQVWDHRVVFNMPPETAEFKENTTPPGKQGRNTGGENAYGGPCPPDREHRYVFKLYALDTMLNLKEGATKAEVETAIQGHTLASTELIGRYQRQ